MEVLLERGVGLLGGGDVAGLEILSELAEECGDRILLAGGLAGLAAVMKMMVAVGAAESRAGLLQILLDCGEIRLSGGEIARFQMLRQLRDGGRERIAALHAGSWREQSVLRGAGN